MTAQEIPTTKLKIKNKVLPVVVILLLIIQLFAPQKTWEVLLISLGGALVLSFLWALSLKRGLGLNREMRSSWAQVGDQLRENFFISNDGRFPALWVTVLDYSFPGYQINTARFLEGQSVRRWIKGSLCKTRGYYIVGPTELIAGDPFGLFSVSVRYPESQRILVVPPVIPLPSIEIATGDRVGDGGKRKYSPERTVTASGIREYVTGDDLHTIHWLTSARRDDLFVRIFDKTPSSDWWIFLDVDKSVQIGEGQDATEEYAIIMAASIAERGLRDGRSVGLVAQGFETTWLPPKSGSSQRWEILHSLATILPGSTKLASMLANTQRTLGRSTSAIIITPSVNMQWVNALGKLMHKGIALTVILLDPPSFGGDEPSQAVVGKLAAWGINYHLITPDIYERPASQDYFVWQKTPYGKKSSSFTGDDLNWGKPQ